MHVTFKNPGFAYSVDSILRFQTPEASDWWKSSLYHFYPQLDRERMERLRGPEQAEYLREVLCGAYREIGPELAQRAEACQAHWDANRREVEEALERVFQMSLAERFQDLTANITLNPICPRFLAARTFDIFYLNSPRGALGTALHEIVHFLWFDQWSRLFQDDPAEYETPHLKWLFSEMAVKPVLGTPGLPERNPYYPDGCVYGYFSDMTVGGRPILDTMEELFAMGSIEKFMEAGYRYCREHEAEIRRQVR